MAARLVYAYLLWTVHSRSQQPPVEGLHRLSIGVLTSGQSDVRGPGGTWRLGPFNKTSKIDVAYRYSGKVVVAGWIGCCAGVTTIIDSSTGAEILEFLAYDPHITPAGIIVFRHFYPHCSDPSIISDVIEKLDLNREIPRNVPSQPNENPIDQVGEVLYPSTPILGIRHEIGHNLLITGAAKVLFLIDGLSSGKLCVVRQQLSGSAAEKRECFDSAAFGVHTLGEVHISQVFESAFGDLVLSTEIGLPNSSVRREFEIDKESLRMNETKIAPRSAEGTIAIPWPIQKKALAAFVPLDMKSQDIVDHGQETVRVHIDIEQTGAVHNVEVAGASEPIAKSIKRTLLQWKVNPTILDGRSVGVTTEFSSQIHNLSDSFLN
jgi:hypothetical protein